MGKSMTSGNAFKIILLFALPLIFGNFFQQTYNLVDSAIVGKTLGDNALGSVGVSSSVQFLVLGFCQGTAIGFSIPVATKFGANRLDEMKRYIFNGALLIGIIAIIVTLLTVSLTGPILKLLQTPVELYDNAYAYLATIFIGLPATLLYNYLSGVLRAIGDAKLPFLFLVFSALLNIGLDLFCIINLHMGVFGAAFATVVSQALSGILCLIYIGLKVKLLIPDRQNRVIEGYKVRRLLAMGLPMGFQFSITAIGSMAMQMSNNTLGTVYVNAYAAGLKIKQFMMCPFDAIGTAAATFVSQNYGAQKMDRIRHGCWVGFIIAILYSLIATIVMVGFGRDLALLFLDANSVDVLDACAKYLSYIGLFYWALGILIVSRQVIQGLGYSNRALIAGFVEMIARCVVCFGFTGRFGFLAICCADQVAWIFGMLYLIPCMLVCLKHAQLKIN